MELIINLIIVGLILGLTWALTSEGLWGAALMFFNVLFSAMITFNFYEPLATLIDSTGINWGFSDTLCMLLIFCVSVTVLRMTTETIAPAQVRFPMAVFHAGRLIFGLGGAMITIAVALLAFHAAPVDKKIFKVIDYEFKPPFKLGLDHGWLGFFQRETGAVFARYGVGQRDPFQEFGRGQGGERYMVQFFDPRAEWLIQHQQARPYGEGTIIGEETAAAGGAEAGAGAAEGAAGGAGAAPGPGGGGPRGGRGRGGPGGPPGGSPPN